MLKFRISLFFLLFSIPLWALNYGFTQITNRDGLTQNDVLCIFQDSRGFMWFGTNDGLNRYDGREFTPYRRAVEELSSGLIRGLVEDNKDNLWVATFDNGINQLNLQTGIIDQFFQDDRPGLSLNSNNINDIVCDTSGVVYYVTNEGVGKIIQEEGKTCIINLKDPANDHNFYRKARLFVDNSNRLWLMSGRGLYYFEHTNLKLYFQIPDGQIKKMAESNLRFVVGTSIGSFSFQKGEKMSSPYVPTFFSHQPVTDLMVDAHQSVWLGNNTGVEKFSLGLGSSGYQRDDFFEKDQKQEMEKMKVLSFNKDRTGIIYIGTNGSGVMKINPNRKKFRTFKLNDPSGGNKIRAIFQDSRQNIYIGKEKGKLFYLPASHLRNFEQDVMFNGFPWQTDEINQPVFTITQVVDARGVPHVISGSDSNDPILDLSVNKMNIPDLKARIFAMAQGSDGLVWIGTYNQGLFRFDPKGRLPLKSFSTDARGNALYSNIIRSLFFDSKNRLWIGTAQGLNLLPREEQAKSRPSFVRINEISTGNKDLNCNYILPVFESKTGQIWVGTMGGGLSHLLGFDPKTGKAEFENFTTKEGLPNNVIKSILEDDSGNLWVATNRGLCRFNPQSRSFDNFDINDGLQDYEFSELTGCKLNDGEMLFGGVNGINAFYPNQIVKDTTSATPVFTGLMVLNKEVEVGEVLHNRVLLEKDINDIGRINLNYGENSFAVQFSSLHFGHPEKNKCMYRLGNFDREWVIAPSGEVAKYTNLKPGRYLLEIKAANSDGVWSNEVKRLEIAVSPPFLLTWFMKIVYVVLIILGFLFFRKFTIINANRKHELLIQEIEKQKDEEIYRVKFQFFTNIAHEFKTPLMLIVNPLERLVKNQILPSQQVLNNYFQVMHRNANVLLRLINQLMDFRKIDQGKMKLNIKMGNLRDFLADIHESFSSLAESKNISFNFVSHITNENIYFDPSMLEKVVYNILSNAFKFTSENGVINFELLDDNSAFVTIIITDSGIGIPIEAQEYIFDRFFQVPLPDAQIQPGTGIGLAYCKSLIELMHAKIEFKSKLGVGTTFFIKIPNDKNVFNDGEISENRQWQLSRPTNSLLSEKVIAGPLFRESQTQVNHEDWFTLLVVEDNADLRNFLRDYFSPKYNVLEAVNGQEGYTKCVEQKPDLIITDVVMPMVDGLVMSQKIKENPETSHIPIIMLSSQTSEDQQKEGLFTGADSYLSKPFNVEVLSAQILSLLKNRHALRAKYLEKIKVVPSDIEPSRKDDRFINQLLELVEANLADPAFSVQKLASLYGCSQTSLNTKLVSLTGQKAKIFIRSIRLKRAAQLLEQGDLSISEITYQVGFNDLQYFRKCFMTEFGCLPSKYPVNA